MDRSASGHYLDFGAVRIGLMLPTTVNPSRASVLAVAQAAERLGFDSLWTNSHTVVPASFAPGYPYTETGLPSWNATTAWADAMTTLAFAAAVTERVRPGVAAGPPIITDPPTPPKQAPTPGGPSTGRLGPR